MARELTAGQQAAARYARARRGELGLSQAELAKKARISRRTLVEFEAERSWPNPDTLARLERMGLDLVVGRLAEYAAKNDVPAVATTAIDEEIAAILESNMHPDLKLRLVDRLRVISADKVAEQTHREVEDIELRLAESGDPGEDKERRDTA